MKRHIIFTTTLACVHVKLSYMTSHIREIFLLARASDVTVLQAYSAQGAILIRCLIIARDLHIKVV